MLVFAASDKGGTGRSITSCNIAYRHALRGGNACYLDFDFGSPTAGSIFQIGGVELGVRERGLHSYLRGREQSPIVDEPETVNVWMRTSRVSLRRKPGEAGRLALVPGDRNGGEFRHNDETVQRCVDLFLRLRTEYDLCLVDLSAGRSYATQMVLEATARPELRGIPCRWLVFHRWTRQHILAAASLAFGRDGIADMGERCGHTRTDLENSIRFVRTAVVDPNSEELRGLRPAQVAWLRDCNQALRELAAQRRVGRSAALGTVPLDPVLQWREQLLLDNDVYARDIANRATVAAFDDLARKLVDDSVWEPL